MSTPAPSTTAEEPWPVRTVARKIAAWIDRLGAVWVEGQLTQVTARPGTGTAFLVLRDPAADVSLSLTAPMAVVRGSTPPLGEGQRVVVHGKPSFFLGRGSLSLRVDEVRAVGVGELLARIERLRALLGAEGLFDRARKRPLPRLPGCVGLITGRASAAEHDVVSVATGRWPAVRFRTLTTATQGVNAVPQILEALAALDADPAVEVIVLARGGGSVEDLLPFSDEALCRGVARCRTPVVTAIGTTFGILLTGSFIIETAFTIPGLGMRTVEAIKSLDMPVVQASVFVAGAMFILINTLVDMLLPILDPRIRESQV